MTPLRALAAGLILCASASSAAASPIAFAGGQLDGTLRFFRSGTVADDHIQVLTLTLGHEYVLGIDFFPGVPLYNLQNLVPYDSCVAKAWYQSAACTGQTFGIPLGGAVLTDGCNSLPVPDPQGGTVALVARGNCTFAEKWDIAQAGGWEGVLVAETDPGPVGAFAFPPGFLGSPTIPFMRVTQQTGQDLYGGRSALFVGSTGQLLGDSFFPIVEMRVSWTPDIQAVPEPTSLVLLISGGVTLIAKARTRCRTRNGLTRRPRGLACLPFKVDQGTPASRTGRETAI